MEWKPLSGREYPRYSAIKSFFRLPIAASIAEDFEVGIFGIPFDGGTSYRPGARFAPSAVRELSSLGRGFHLGREVQIFEKLKVADLGDCSTVPIDLNQTYVKIEEFVGELLKLKKKFLAVGGDHSVTLPVLRALKKTYKQPLNFIHFDAHLDTYPAAWNCEYHHGSFLRHAVEENLVEPAQVLQIGIRGPLADSSDLLFSQKHKFRVATVDDIRKNGLESFLKTLPTFENGPTYISYDIDVLDPAYAPGTGTPVAGGLTTYEVQKIFRQLKIKNLIGGDVVEISPPFDQSAITAIAGVDALFEMLALLAQNK
jgi:agmatinase/guanidinopropionase